MKIRQSLPEDFDKILAIINDAAQAYRGVIPSDCWHEPYMSGAALAQEIAEGVLFWVVVEEGSLLGVMGVQDKADVALVRHAYTATAAQRKGVGTKLLLHLQTLSPKPMLIGTWAAAVWAIEFYTRHGFTVVSDEQKNRLLQKYWSVPARQVETSVVLAQRRGAQEAAQPVS